MYAYRSAATDSPSKTVPTAPHGTNHSFLRFPSKKLALLAGQHRHAAILQLIKDKCLTAADAWWPALVYKECKFRCALALIARARQCARGCSEAEESRFDRRLAPEMRDSTQPDHLKSNQCLPSQVKGRWFSFPAGALENKRPLSVSIRQEWEKQSQAHPYAKAFRTMSGERAGNTKAQVDRPRSWRVVSPLVKMDTGFASLDLLNRVSIPHVGAVDFEMHYRPCSDRL